MEEELALNRVPEVPAPEVLEETEVNVLEGEDDDHDDDHDHDHQQQQQSSDGNQSTHRNPRSFPQRIRETLSYFTSVDEWNDAWSCLVVLLTFCSFACMTIILGFYGSFNLQLGPNSSYLIDASSIFVRNVKAEETDAKVPGPTLYGFHRSPPLDVKVNWSKNHNATVEPYLYKEWIYYLNAGSRIEISYDVKFAGTGPLFLTIAQGRDSLQRWVEDPSYPNNTLSWKMIYGTGRLEQEIYDSDAYYVAVGNINSDTQQIVLNITAHSLQYDTSGAYFKCSLDNRVCSFRMHLFQPNSAILTTPGPEHAKDDEDWYVEVSFIVQWISYICGSCIITILVLTLFKLCNLFQRNARIGAPPLPATQNGEEREPLLSPKGDRRFDWGSSYESIPDDEDDLDEKLLEGYPEGKKVAKEGEASYYNPRRLCIICFDAPRDCFFLPCGHCATCFSCGSRVLEEAGNCPVCRRKMKKVRRIFPV